MKRFRLDNGKIDSKILLDLLHLNEPYLDGIMLEVFYDEENNLCVQYQNKDLEYLYSFDYQNIKMKALQFAKTCLDYHRYEYFSSENHSRYVMNVIENNNLSTTIISTIDFKKYHSIQFHSI